MDVKNKTKIDIIEEKLCEEIEWYLDNNIPLDKKQAKLQVSLGTNRMINSVIMIETLKQRSKALKNADEETQRKIERFGNGKV